MLSQNWVRGHQLTMKQEKYEDVLVKDNIQQQRQLGFTELQFCMKLLYVTLKLKSNHKDG